MGRDGVGKGGYSIDARKCGLVRARGQLDENRFAAVTLELVDRASYVRYSEPISSTNSMTNNIQSRLGYRNIRRIMEWVCYRQLYLA